MEPLPLKNEILDIAPDVIKPTPNPLTEKFRTTPLSTSPTANFNSLGFKNEAVGWGLSTGGDAQFNGNHIVSTNFTPVVSLKGLTIYISDGTTPNGNLTGQMGDICFGADAGKAYKCNAAGTAWTSFT